MKRREAKSPSQRQLKVGEELRHALAWVLERGELRDPGLAGTPVTITEVSASPDLRRATVFVTPLGGGDPTPVLEALKRAEPFLRQRIAKTVHLRHVPKLSFQADRSFDTAQQIDDLLHRPEVARDLEANAEMPARDGDDPDGT